MVFQDAFDCIAVQYADRNFGICSHGTDMVRLWLSTMKYIPMVRDSNFRSSIHTPSLAKRSQRHTLLQI